ncbi:MAG: hypothetical protein Q7V20_18500 [Aquabacterium sp.]|uniref:hypothetical protein n=1 Tax=Aquabacterium sp. TaxID=1872578 RepID=UPI002717F1BD|nr:hypothetical protein [Aquabacterium sp.]MDO9005440.1 hypothetical protein [Aquabacterium sp.]
MTLNQRLALTALLAGLSTTTAQAGESYANVGIPGVMLGYAHSVNSQWGLRGDVATLGSVKRHFTESGITYQGTIKAQRLGLFADYFPMQGGFRLTGGLTLNHMRVRLKSQFDGTTSVTLGSQTLTPTAGDYFNAELKFPRVMPYLGVGWGHQARDQGLGFVADLGVMIGKAKVTTTQNVVANYPGLVTQADVDAETQKLRDGVGDIRFVPQVSVGVSYRY